MYDNKAVLIIGNVCGTFPDISKILIGSEGEGLLCSGEESISLTRFG